MKSATAIIVNWNTKDMLRVCLQGLLRQEGIELTVMVVDNNSSDESDAMIRNEFPHVHLITNTVNKGFSAANNQALQIARGDYLLLINPDIEFTSTGAVRALLKEQDALHAGIAGPRLLNSDKTIQPSVRSNPDWWSQFLIISKLQYLFPKSKRLNQYFKRNFDYATSNWVDQISGAFFSISRECFTKVGLLDESFWIWFEEVDYCMRAQQQNERVRFVSSASVIHHGGQSFQQVIPKERHKRYCQSLQQFAKKYFPRWQQLLLRCGSGIGSFFAYLTPNSLRIRTYGK